MKWLIIAQILWTGPKLTPREATDILLPHEYHSVQLKDGPKFIVIDSSIPYPISYYRYHGSILKISHFNGNNAYAHYIQTRAGQVKVERRNIQSIKKIGYIQKKSKRLHD